MPAFSEELQAKLDSGKLHLGGCCISGVPDENGDMINLDPGRYCNDCHKDFARPPYLVSKDHSSAEAYADIVTGIRFSYGGFFQGHTEITIKRNKNGAIAVVSQFPYESKPVPDRQITALRWMRLVNRLYSELYLHVLASGVSSHILSGITDHFLSENWEPINEFLDCQQPRLANCLFLCCHRLNSLNLASLH